ARKRANLIDRLRWRIVIGRVLLGGEQDEGVGPHHLLERENRLLASDEEGRDQVRKCDEVAQRQHRIGSGFIWRKGWARLCSGHGPSPFYSRCAPRPAGAQPRQSADGSGRGIRAAAATSAPKGQVYTLCPS